MIPRTEAALDAAPKSFNLVIVESDTEIAILGLHRHVMKIIVRKPLSEKNKTRNYNVIGDNL